MASRNVIARITALHVLLSVHVRQHRRAITILATILLILLAGWAVADLGIAPSDIIWPQLVFAALLLIPSQIVNALELVLCAKATGNRMPLRRALYSTSAATIANLLPLPAGAILRGKALSDLGAGMIDSGKIIVAAGLLWATMAVAVASIALLPSTAAGALIAGGTLASLAVAIWITRRSTVTTAMGFVIVRLALLVLLLGRLWFCFAALGQSETLRDICVLVLSGVLANGIGIVPAGIGIAEAIGALLAGLVGAAPAAAVLALSLNRLLGLAASGIVLLVGASVTLRPAAVTPLATGQP